MSASALPKPERIHQVWLEEAMDFHENYLQGIHGGQRLSVSFKDGRHLDFSGRNLASADMVAAELSHAVFEGTCLARSNLFCANLESAQMRECDLTRADLRGITLSGANLECANLREARVDNACFVDCNLSGADLRGTAMNLADLRGAVGMRP